MSRPAVGKPRASVRAAGKGDAVSGLESHLGFWLRFISNHVSGRFQRLMEAKGVSVSEWVALRQLFQSGAASPAQLMDALGMTKGAISKIISRLEDKQLVGRETSAADRRAQRVLLTAAGRRLVPQLARLADRNDARFFGHLPASTRDELIALMADIARRHEFRQVPLE